MDVNRKHERKSVAREPAGKVDKVFDYERSLVRLGGDPSLFCEIVALFLEDAPQLLERARLGLRDENLPELERAVHSLKGLSANFDAMPFASAAYCVEQYAHDQDLARVAESFPELEQEFARLWTTLTTFRNCERHSGDP